MKKIQHRLASTIFAIGIIFLALILGASTLSHRRADFERVQALAIDLASDAAQRFDDHLQFEVNKARTMASAPLVFSALRRSNAQLSSAQQIEAIADQWLSTKDPSASFFTPYLRNELAGYLQKQLHNFSGTYGEIFLTNRFGALVASTGRLTTFNHGHKYWWKGAFAEGAGAAYFDDRGYDESVGDYVLGIVVPVMDGGELLGILKCNVKILGPLAKTVTEFEHFNPGTLSIARDNGQVVYENGVAPLSTQLPQPLIDMISAGSANGVTLSDGQSDLLYAFAPILLNPGLSLDHVDSGASIDHKLGNTGVGWRAILKTDLSQQLPLWSKEQRLTLISGLILSTILAMSALLLGRRISAPLQQLLHRVKRVGSDLEDLTAPASLQADGEVQALSEAFNDMLRRLRNTTITRNRLAQEVDIRREVEQALRASQELFKEAQRVALLASFEWHLGTRVLRWSEGADAILPGILMEGTEEDFLNAIDPQDRSKVERSLLRALESDDKAFEVDFRLRREQGIEQVVQGQAKVFRDNEGQALRMIGTVQDISRRKLAEDALQNALNQTRGLAGALKEKNRELEKTHSELKDTQVQLLQREKMASIGQLAAGVAHEINNPVGFISSNLNSLGKFVDSLLRVLGAQRDALDACAQGEEREALNSLWKKEKIDFVLEDIQELIAESIEGTQRVSQIVKDLKSFSRVDQPDKSLVDLRDCLESTLNIAWNELKYKTTLEKELGEIPRTRCYPQQLNQVFLNLLVNASQAIEEKGIIRLKSWHQDEQIHISVSDTGKGIEPDKLERVFEPFYTTKPAGAGTGLGLSISYDIVKKHEGEIQVSSTPGEGTTFTLSLPVCP